MSDSGSAGHLQFTGTAAGRGTASAAQTRRPPQPVAMLVVDIVTGEVTAANPAGYRRICEPGGARLTRWLATLAVTADPEDDVTTVRALDGGYGSTPDGVTVCARCTVIEHRSRRCLLVVLQEDQAPDAAGWTPDPECAAFTLDAVGRVDSWGRSAQRWTGFSPEHVIGSDTTLLHPGPARLAGEPHRALTQAYRAGEYRSEGWRICSGDRSVWAQVTTCALYDAQERLVGFATVMQDLTARRRLIPATPVRIPAPRPPLATRPMRPAPARPRAGTRPGRIPGQRRPSGS